MLEETKKKISETMKRRRSTDLPPWNKGLTSAKKGKTFVQQYGEKLAERIRNKISISNSGKPSPMKGKKHTEESKIKARNSHKKRFVASRYRSFKGSKIEYRRLHHYITNNKKGQETCEHCGKSCKLDLANISGEYKRDINDYLWLCRGCHRAYDLSFGKKSMEVSKSI